MVGAEPQTGADAWRLQARVKWFNPSKGFGFVLAVDPPTAAPAESQMDSAAADIFLHVSALQPHGLTQVEEAAELECEVSHGPRGLQVVRVLAVKPSPERPTDRNLSAARPSRGPEAAADQPTLGGLVKWFKDEKGFGFIVADDTGRDVFVHKTTLRRCGLTAVQTGQRVRMRVVPVDKGREAVWVQIEPSGGEDIAGAAAATNEAPSAT